MYLTPRQEERIIEYIQHRKEAGFRKVRLRQGLRNRVFRHFDPDHKFKVPPKFAFMGVEIMPKFKAA